MTRFELEQRILELVKDAEFLTYSDIQGIAQAIAMEAIEEN